MKLSVFLFLSLLSGTLAAQPRDYGQAFTVAIWDNTTAPHSNGLTTPETESETDRIAGTSQAEMYVFPAAQEQATGQAIVICPGGGYTHLCMDYEGYDVAKWLASHGITAAVLKYRMPNGHPEVPLEDAEQAIRILAGLEAGATGFTARQVGIMGFSAGGHLAAMTSTMAPRTRPAFSLLFYPVITGEEGRSHRGSFDNLLGADRTREQTLRYSLENCVDNLTPPALLLLSDDDRVVPSISSTRYYDALKAHGIEASMHIYPVGGHGWGIRDDFRHKDEWQAALLDWLAHRAEKTER